MKKDLIKVKKNISIKKESEEHRDGDDDSGFILL